MVKCAAQISENDPSYAARKALQDKGAAYAEEQVLLSAQTHTTYSRGGPQTGDLEYTSTLFGYNSANAAKDYSDSTSILWAEARAIKRDELEKERDKLNDVNDPVITVCAGPAGCRQTNRRSAINGELIMLTSLDVVLPNNATDLVVEGAITAATGGLGKVAKVGGKIATKADDAMRFADDAVLGLGDEALDGTQKYRLPNVGDSAEKGGLKTSKAETLKQNKAKGNAFENEIINEKKTEFSEVGEQVTIKTDSGTKTRVDILTKDKNGNIGCIECKSSETAPLTSNQKAAFPEIEETGGTIVGKGKLGFEGGTKIPPTKVEIIRPSKE